MSDYGRETIVVVQIDQPLCSRTWGDGLASPTPASGCTAVLSADAPRKCFNSRATCEDPANYNPGTLTLTFSRPQNELARYYGYVIPSLISYSVTPLELNLGALDKNSSALGKREVVTLAFEDHRHSDLLVDKYRLERETGAAIVGGASTAQAGALTSLTLASTASTTDDVYNGLTLKLVSGVGSVQEREILDYTGTTKVARVRMWNAQYLSLPAELGNYASTPDSVANSITGDIVIRMKLRVDPNAVGVIVGKWVESTNQRAFCVFMSFGLPILVIDAVGTGGVAVENIAATAFVDMDVVTHLHVELDADNGAGGYAVTFKTSTDGGTWTQLGATVTGSGVKSIFNSSAPVEIGSLNGGTGSLFLGDVYSVEIYNDRGLAASSMVLKFDPINDALLSDSSFVSSTGETWTVNSPGSPATYLWPIPDSTTQYQISRKPYESGTFWGKWLARNPYYAGYEVRVYQGFVGQSLDEMSVRYYIIDQVKGPADGVVTIVAKDKFSLIEARKAVAPTASRGELSADISAVASSATLSPSGIGDLDYPVMEGSPSEFYVAIGKEIIKCSRSGDVLTFLQRGCLGTTAEAHNDDDLVQWVLVYDRQLVRDIVYDLLTTYGGIDPDDIPDADWDLQAAALTNLYTGRVCEPTPVADLVGELAMQAGFTVWPDTMTGEIVFRALRSAASDATVTDAEWLIDGSLDIKRQDDRRVSQVWVYYGQRNPLEDLEDPQNYYSRFVDVDSDAESSEQYGQPKIFQVFSRWIPQFGRTSATETAERILAIFRDPPIEVTFDLDQSKDGELNLARYFDLETADVQDADGSVVSSRQAVIKLARKEDRVSVKSQGITFGDLTDTDGVRVIYIENTTQDIVLRAVHDSQYSELPSGSPNPIIRFIVESGVIVGSSSTGSAAITTGAWPSTVSVELVIQSGGRVQGKAGRGGNGQDGSVTLGTVGEAGGNAIEVTSAITIDNDGEIWAGGGGGGGGGVSISGFTHYGGGGGGGGAGSDPGAGGLGGANNGFPVGYVAQSGSSGTTEHGGAGGAGAFPGPGSAPGGAGGEPGVAGTTGTTGTYAAGTVGGQPGNYIVGNSLVTWSSTGDRRGGAA